MRNQPHQINLFMNKIHQEDVQDEKISNDKCGKYANFIIALGKSSASREKLNDKSVANSTPTACFFIRSTRTPKKRPKPCRERGSMVACYGQPLAVGCVPLIAVSHPVTRYRQTVRSQAVTLQNKFSGVTQMIYLFNAIDRRDFSNTALNLYTFPKRTMRVKADSREQARKALSRDYFLINAGTINENHPNIHRTLKQGVIYA